jgi:hypothetical protein
MIELNSVKNRFFSWEISDNSLPWLTISRCLSFIGLSHASLIRRRFEVSASTADESSECNMGWLLASIAKCQTHKISDWWDLGKRFGATVTNDVQIAFLLFRSQAA